MDTLNSPIAIEDTDNMDSPATSLMVAVSRAAGRPLHPYNTDDMVTMQNGCDILNHWGHGPEFRFAKCLRCPHSLDLGEMFMATGTIDGSSGETHIPDGDVRSLSGILSKGSEYSTAYAAVLVAIDHNPGLNLDSIKDMVSRIYPEVSETLDEAVSSVAERMGSVRE